MSVRELFERAKSVITSQRFVTLGFKADEEAKAREYAHIAELAGYGALVGDVTFGMISVVVYDVRKVVHVSIKETARFELDRAKLPQNAIEVLVKVKGKVHHFLY